VSASASGVGVGVGVGIEVGVGVGARGRIGYSDLVVLRFAPFVVLLAGCRSPTEITLILRTDVPCAEMTGITIAMQGDEAPRTESRSCDASGALGTIVLVPSGAKTDALDIEVVGGRGVEPASCSPKLGPNCILARRRIRYLPHVPLTMPIDLRGACAGIRCVPGDTCVAGVCHPADIDPGACTTSSGCGEYALGPPSSRPPPTPPPTPPPPFNGPSYVGVTDARVAVGSSSMTVPIPTGVVAGDLLLFGAYTDLSLSTLALPAEWVSQRSVTSTTHNWRGWSASRRATGSDPALVVSLTNIGANGAVGVLAAYRGVSPQPTGPSNLLLVNDATKAATYTAPGLAASGSDNLLVAFYMSDATGGTGAAWGAPAGTTARIANEKMLLVDAPAMPPGSPSYTATFLVGSGAVAESLLTP